MQGRVFAYNWNIRKLVDEAIKKYGLDCDLNFIDVSQVTDMQVLFGFYRPVDEITGKLIPVEEYSIDQKRALARSQFNGDISRWNVSKVTNMSCMFYESRFNGDISRWDVSKVTDMSCMFCKTQFNGGISHWVVSNVTNMSQMFAESQFNGDIGGWDVSKVKNMSGMFYKSQFNRDISRWKVFSVTDMSIMFLKSQFNGDISHWAVSNVSDMSCMFAESQFNGDISSWNVLSECDVDLIFLNSKFETSGKAKKWLDRVYRERLNKRRNRYGKIIARDLKDLELLIEMMIFVDGINCSLNSIDVSGVTDMTHLFENSKFNGDISEWDVSRVTIMYEMFKSSSFQGNIANWNVSRVKNMNRMFKNSLFNGDISQWNVARAIDCMADIFENSPIEKQLEKQPIYYRLEDGSLRLKEYATNKTIKFIVKDAVEKYGVNADLNFIDVSQVTDFSDLFIVSYFNGNIGKWDVSNAMTMKDMFRHSNFNGDISNWNVSCECDVSRMFEGSDFEKSGKAEQWLNLICKKIIEKKTFESSPAIMRCDDANIAQTLQSIPYQSEYIRIDSNCSAKLEQIPGKMDRVQYLNADFKEVGKVYIQNNRVFAAQNVQQYENSFIRRSESFFNSGALKERMFRVYSGDRFRKYLTHFCYELYNKDGQMEFCTTNINDPSILNQEGDFVRYIYNNGMLYSKEVYSGGDYKFGSLGNRNFSLSENDEDEYEYGSSSNKNVYPPVITSNGGNLNARYIRGINHLVKETGFRRTEKPLLIVSNKNGAEAFVYLNSTRISRFIVDDLSILDDTMCRVCWQEKLFKRPNGTILSLIASLIYKK